MFAFTKITRKPVLTKCMNFFLTRLKSFLSSDSTVKKPFMLPSSSHHDPIILPFKMGGSWEIHWIIPEPSSGAQNNLFHRNLHLTFGDTPEVNPSPRLRWTKFDMAFSSIIWQQRLTVYRSVACRSKRACQSDWVSSPVKVRKASIWWNPDYPVSWIFLELEFKSLWCRPFRKKIIWKLKKFCGTIRQKMLTYTYSTFNIVEHKVKMKQKQDFRFGKHFYLKILKVFHFKMLFCYFSMN